MSHNSIVMRLSIVLAINGIYTKPVIFGKRDLGSIYATQGGGVQLRLTKLFGGKICLINKLYLRDLKGI